MVSLFYGLVGLAHPASEMVSIPAGRVTPLFGLDAGQTDFRVDALLMDERLVTNDEFIVFLKQVPAWKKDQVASALADERYLSHLINNRPPRGYGKAAVVHVSWFAAQAYCEWRGTRLPSTLEWEYVAAASETQADASKDASFVAKILGWYSKPNRPEALLGPPAAKNYYGVYDLHQRVWEWTLDFNGAFNTTDNRQDGDRLNNLFCGTGAIGSARREDYAAFMRYALRSSLSANSTLSNLGFRCATSVKERTL